ncbi:MAG TPA: ATP-binding protein [Verrucomicrobiae bacterium]|nr:ATP-binding protein [Verrucomicrobiae bacterium]
MPREVRVLLIDANEIEAVEAARKLKESKATRFSIHTVNSLKDGVEAAEKMRFDIALVDPEVPGWQGLKSMSELQSSVREIPVVVFTNSLDHSAALEAVRAGAQDYVLKGRMNSAALERVLSYGIERARARRRTALQSAVSRALAESDSLAQAEERLLPALCKYLECSYGQIWHCDAADSALENVRAFRVAPGILSKFEERVRPIRFVRGRGLPGQVWALGAPLLIPNLMRAELFPGWEVAVQEGARSLLAFPIVIGVRVLGVMEFLSPDPVDADDELAKVVASIGSQMGQFMARKLAEQLQDRLTRERLLILDSASEGIFGVGLDLKITFMNRAAARMFDCPAAQAIDQDAHDLMRHARADGAEYSRDDGPILAVLKSGQEIRCDVEFFRKRGGDRLAVEYSSIPVVEGGAITGAVVCFSDITARKQMEVELRHAQKLEAVAGLAAGIAHEINTPIQFVADNTRFLQNSFLETINLVKGQDEIIAAASLGPVAPELLARDRDLRERMDWTYLESEVPKALEQMLEGIGRVATIVRAMKEFSHVDQSTEKTYADLNRALESTLVVARNEFKYVADIRTEFGAIPPVACHLGDLNQVFLNLLVNAAHAIGSVVRDTGEKGLVTVRTRHDGATVEIAISDTGTGIPESIHSKIFEPFFTTKEVGKGTGQGLALARAIVVEKHGGTLTFDTEVGKGSTFYVRLPVNPVRAGPEAVLV